MKVVIPTIGSRGDVQPFIALSQGLRRAGHDVKLASHPIMQELVESHRVAFAAIGPDIDLDQEAAAIREQSGNVIVGLVRVMRFAFKMLERSHEDILELCRGADLVVSPAQSAAGKNEADQLGLPTISANLMPWAIPVDDPGRPLIKRLVFSAADRLIRLITTRPLNRMRRKQGLPPVGPEGFSSPLLDLIPVSPSVFAPNVGWAPRHRVVGYWFVDGPIGWKPPVELLEFLDSGPPPLVVSLGAMSRGNGNASATANLFMEAIRQVGMRAIIQGWEEALKRLSRPTTVYAAGSLPHSWLLPRSAGLVHHGGFGTTSAGFRAGIPQLVIPHIADQFYWAQRVQSLGVGPAAIRRPKLTVQRLAAALTELAGNEAFCATASLLGEQIRHEQGVAEAVQLIEEAVATETVR